jgi:hypothetical protein
MESVYIVIENGEAYPNAYTTYAAAVRAVNDKHQLELNRQVEENPESRNEILGYVNPSENASGTTSLYIEKGIHILVQRLPVVRMAGGKRSRSSRSSRSRSSRSNRR